MYQIEKKGHIDDELEGAGNDHHDQCGCFLAAPRNMMWCARGLG